MIVLDNVSVASGDVVLLSPVNLKVGPGEALVVRGENGVGKSTLLRVLVGGHKPTTGSAYIGGDPIVERSRIFRRRVASMIGLPPMAADLTVFDHVALVATTWTNDPTQVDRVTADVLDELGLTKLGNRFPHELSSGQTQLFGLALVFARPFEVLILDEPEQRLDPDRLDLVARALKARRAAGATLAVATHSPVLAEEIGTQTLLLRSAV